MTISKKNKGIIISVMIVIMLAFGVIAIIYSNSKTNQGAKQIQVEVIISQTDKKTFKFKTNEEYLGAAVLSQNIIKGEKGQFGLFITEANGKTADEKKEEWWCLTKKGESLKTGIDTTPIADGDKFELTLKIGYNQFE